MVLQLIRSNVGSCESRKWHHVIMIEQDVDKVCGGSESGKVAWIQHALYGSSKQNCDQIGRRQERKERGRSGWVGIAAPQDVYIPAERGERWGCVAPSAHLSHSHTAMINEQECACVQPDTEKQSVCVCTALEGLPSTSRDLKCVYNIMREAKWPAFNA